MRQKRLRQESIADVKKFYYSSLSFVNIQTLKISDVNVDSDLSNNIV